MKLASYLAEENLTYEAFARMTGYTIFAVGKWARDQRLPRPEAMRKIAAITRGRVTANDFNDLDEDLAAGVAISHSHAREGPTPA